MVISIFFNSDPIKTILSDIKTREDAFDIIELIENLSDDETRSIYNDNTILLHACRYQCLDVVEHLIQYPHYARMDFVTKRGESPLIIACEQQNQYMCTTLLSQPDWCNLDQQTYNTKLNSLMICCNSGITMQKIAKNILQYPNRCGLLQRDDKNNTCLILACDNLLEEIALFILNCCDLSVINAVNHKGKSALDIARVNQMKLVVEKIQSLLNI